jgi:hypothetical protein
MKLAEVSKANPNAILVHSGIIFDVFNPKIEDITIEDIAHALSNICRYGGHSPKFYSVAQHSVFCSHDNGTPKEQLELLMHDASEAYLADLPRPIKRNMPNYIVIEDALLKLIFQKYDLRFPLVPNVKKVDDELLQFEYKAFFEEPDTFFKFWTPEEARKNFINRFNYLTNLIENDNKK